MALRDRSGGGRCPLDGSTSRSPIPAPPTRPVPTLTTRRTSEPGDVLVYQFATESVMAGWLCRPTRTGGHQLSQHHAAGVLRTVEQRHHPVAGRRPSSNWLELAPRAALGIAVSRVRRRASCAAAGCARTDGRSRSPTCRSRLPDPDPALVERLRARRAGPGRHRGCRWGGWPPTRPTTRPSPPCSWPGPSTDPDARLTLVGSPDRAGLRRAPSGATPARSAWPTRSTSSPASATRELAAYYRCRRRAGDALGPRGVRRAPGRGHGPGTPDRGLRRRRGRRGARRCRCPARPRSIPGAWPMRCPDLMADPDEQRPSGGRRAGPVRGPGSRRLRQNRLVEAVRGVVRPVAGRPGEPGAVRRRASARNPEPLGSAAYGRHPSACLCMPRPPARTPPRT